ncbi:hypothetical protein L6164_013914 [Bauhinia variegata]|uniref:Uncharacterized protein n=1 Tax=Bauhinia variegata TaxID=167791 RepID=A0ACB9NGL7_BAUVA|nr:hypothetical protein L6164_013914 [Bauhinia variegata]
MLFSASLLNSSKSSGVEYYRSQDSQLAVNQSQFSPKKYFLSTEVKGEKFAKPRYLMQSCHYNTVTMLSPIKVRSQCTIWTSKITTTLAQNIGLRSMKEAPIKHIFSSKQETICFKNNVN